MRTYYIVHDDTQLCVHCRPEEIATTTPKLERCITDMDNWMSANRLKLNMDKTELLCAGTRYSMSMLNDSGPSLQLNNVTVKASQHVRVLGVHLSSDMTHVSSSFRSFVSFVYRHLISGEYGRRLILGYVNVSFIQ